MGDFGGGEGRDHGESRGALEAIRGANREAKRALEAPPSPELGWEGLDGEEGECRGEAC